MKPPIGTLVILTLAVNFLSKAALATAPLQPPPWQSGKAEITSYDLQQARYGESHSGQAVLIYVTEPFSHSKQVKLDDWSNAGSDRVEVLKLNFTKTFNTGIYPYSMMLSVFTPLEHSISPRSLKVTASVTEWCGQVFTQMNLRNNNYHLRCFSYFESDGDTSEVLPAEWLEDELWTRLRLNPQSLPQGEVLIIPGLFYSRLEHKRQIPLKATAEWLPLAEGKRSYLIRYTQRDERTLRIDTTIAAPHVILGWQEQYARGGGSIQKTIATRKATILSAYWSENGLADRKLREQLGLSPDQP